MTFKFRSSFRKVTTTQKAPVFKNTASAERFIDHANAADILANHSVKKHLADVNFEDHGHSVLKESGLTRGHSVLQNSFSEKLSGSDSILGGAGKQNESQFGEDGLSSAGAFGKGMAGETFEENWEDTKQSITNTVGWTAKTLVSDAVSTAAGAGIAGWVAKAKKSTPAGYVLGVVAGSLAKGLAGEVSGEAAEKKVKEVVKGAFDFADEQGKDAGDALWDLTEWFKDLFKPNEGDTAKPNEEDTEGSGGNGGTEEADNQNQGGEQGASGSSEENTDNGEDGSDDEDGNNGGQSGDSGNSNQEEGQGELTETDDSRPAPDDNGGGEGGFMTQKMQDQLSNGFKNAKDPIINPYNDNQSGGGLTATELEEMEAEMRKAKDPATNWGDDNYNNFVGTIEMNVGEISLKNPATNWGENYTSTMANICDCVLTIQDF